MDDEAILAGLDENPDAFGLFYRRHAAALLEYFLDRTYDRRMAAELCAETFAAALDGARRFARGQVPAEEWLYEHARSLLADARSRGVAEGRARRRLGLPELTVGERFLDELEEELVEAARFRAERHRRAERRPALPRPPMRALLVGAALLVAVAIAVLALAGDDEQRAATGAPAGSSRGIDESRADDCRPAVMPELMARVPVLGETPSGTPLPQQAIDSVRLWSPRIEAVVADGARYWGGDERVDFWAVPVVMRNSVPCAPAERACVVAVAASGVTHSTCALNAPDVGRESWVVGQLRPRQAVIYGFVPAGVISASVTIDGSTARAEAGNGVVGEVLPFPYRDDSKVRVDLVRGPVAPPTVGVVNASGFPGVGENKRAVIREAGYPTLAAPTAAPEPVPVTVVYWRPTGTSRHEAGLVARLLRARLRRIDPERSPEWVAEMPTPVVVVVGSEP